MVLVKNYWYHFFTLKFYSKGDIFFKKLLKRKYICVIFKARKYFDVILFLYFMFKI